MAEKTSRAAYMRAYRKRKAGVDPHRALAESVIETIPGPARTYAYLAAENTRLTEEIARLKRLFAERGHRVEPVEMDLGGMRYYPPDASFTQFRPAPKPSSQKHR